MTVQAGPGTYIEPGYNAEDTRDGNITTKVSVAGLPNTMLPSVYFVLYTVSDLAGNSAPTKSRTVIVRDTVPPAITLDGSLSIELSYGSVYVDPGATAYDTVNGDVTNRVSVINDNQLAPSNQAVGTTVILIYTCSDLSGNTATTTRNVTIVSTASSAASSSVIPIVIGVVVGLLVLVILIVVIVRRRRDTSPSEEPMGLSVMFENPLMQADRAKWYHGDITRETAETRINSKGAVDGSFLVRFKSANEFILSYAFKQKLYHNILMQSKAGKWEVQGYTNAKWGNSLESMIEALRREVLPPFPTQMSLPIAPPFSQSSGSSRKFSQPEQDKTYYDAPNTIQLQSEYALPTDIDDDQVISDDYLIPVVRKGNASSEPNYELPITQSHDGPGGGPAVDANYALASDTTQEYAFAKVSIAAAQDADYAIASDTSMDYASAKPHSGNNEDTDYALASNPGFDMSGHGDGFGFIDIRQGNSEPVQVDGYLDIDEDLV